MWKILRQVDIVSEHSLAPWVFNIDKHISKFNPKLTYKHLVE